MKLQQDLNKEGSEVERPESRPPMQLLNELKAQMQVGRSAQARRTVCLIRNTLCGKQCPP